MSLNKALLWEIKMILWFFVLCTVLSSSIHAEDSSSNEDQEVIFVYKLHSKAIDENKPTKLLSDIIDMNSEDYVLLMNYVEKGYTSKGLTFNIYDANMREAAIALFHILQSLNYNSDDLRLFEDWAHKYINEDLFEYACRLATVYNNNTDITYYCTFPPFLYKPHFYVNGEAIVRALKIYADRRDHNTLDPVMNQFNFSKYSITVNANYSGWNLYRNGCDVSLDYFREDIGLNSYYYGVHLMHPYWMSNSQLDYVNPRHSEFYYYRHQQLMARYLLEKQHLIQSNHPAMNNFCEDGYNSYLIYKNGLPFPTRSSIIEDRTEEKVYLKSMDIAIRDCLMQRCVVLENETTINLTKDNYVDLLAKLIKANYDGIKTANLFRNLLGYGNNGYPAEKYNPAPSLLHHPETSLRDPVYWHIIQYMLKYFTKFSKTLEPFDLSKYETDVFRIVYGEFSDVMTIFKDYQFDIRKGVNIHELPIRVRQRRLDNRYFVFNFKVYSKIDTLAVVRLFLGPPCNNNECWQKFSEFFELSVHIEMLEKGTNSICWSPEEDENLCYDDQFNKEHGQFGNELPYNMFKFPKSLLIPKGLEKGLNLTLFIMISPLPNHEAHKPSHNIYYNHLTYKYGPEPLGFPFHRLAKNYKYSADNYKFYNLTVWHKKRTVDGSEYFSPHLY